MDTKSSKPPASHVIRGGTKPTVTSGSKTTGRGDSGHGNATVGSSVKKSGSLEHVGPAKDKPGQTGSGNGNGNGNGNGGGGKGSKTHLTTHASEPRLAHKSPNASSARAQAGGATDHPKPHVNRNSLVVTTFRVPAKDSPKTAGKLKVSPKTPPTKGALKTSLKKSPSSSNTDDLSLSSEEGNLVHAVRVDVSSITAQQQGAKQDAHAPKSPASQPAHAASGSHQSVTPKTAKRLQSPSATPTTVTMRQRDKSVERKGEVKRRSGVTWLEDEGLKKDVGVQVSDDLCNGASQDAAAVILRPQKPVVRQRPSSYVCQIEIELCSQTGADGTPAPPTISVLPVKSTDQTEDIEEKVGHRQEKVGPVQEVAWDEQGLTWEVYGAALDWQALGSAVQKHLQTEIEALEQRLKTLKESLPDDHKKKPSAKSKRKKRQEEERKRKEEEKKKKEEEKKKKEEEEKKKKEDEKKRVEDEKKKKEEDKTKEEEDKKKKKEEEKKKKEDDKKKEEEDQKRKVEEEKQKKVDEKKKKEDEKKKKEEDKKEEERKKKEEEEKKKEEEKRKKEEEKKKKEEEEKRKKEERRKSCRCWFRCCSCCCGPKQQPPPEQQELPPKPKEQEQQEQEQQPQPQPQQQEQTSA